MLLIERHLLRQFVASVAATAAVLLLVSLGGLFADLVAEIARGKVPAGLLLSQLGLRTVQYIPLVLPLALFIGLLMAIGRLYADSEMAVLAAVGLGPQQLWRPLALVTVPVAVVVLVASTVLAPASARLAKDMIQEANRSFLVAGLEAGRFVELPGRAGVLYVGELSRDGTEFRQLFVQSEREGRLDIITARAGQLVFEGETQRYLRLEEGFRVEGAPEAKDFRLMRFAENEVRVPDREDPDQADDLRARGTWSLFGETGARAHAELNWRLAMPLFTVVLGLFALPLSRSEPRQPRYGLMIVAVLVYLLGMFLLSIARSWLGEGKTPEWLGLWWLLLPGAAVAKWMFLRDGRLPPPPRRSRA